MMALKGCMKRGRNTETRGWVGSYDKLLPGFQEPRSRQYAICNMHSGHAGVISEQEQRQCLFRRENTE